MADLPEGAVQAAALAEAYEKRAQAEREAAPETCAEEETGHHESL